MKLSKIHTILLIALLLFGGVVFLSALNPVSAQTAQPAITPPPVSTPIQTDPTIVALQAVNATQQVQIEQLQRDLAFETQNREYDLRDIRWKWGIASTIVATVAGILSWLGMKSSKDLKDFWKQRTKQMLDEAVFRLDPSNLPIYLPSGEGLEGLHNALQKRRFGKVSFYSNLLDEFNKDNCQGVIVVSLKDKDENEQSKTLSDFTTFLERKLPDGTKTGFIIFAPGDIRVPPKITGSYDNLVTANFPATVVSMVFAVGRGLDIVPNK